MTRIRGAPYCEGSSVTQIPPLLILVPLYTKMNFEGDHEIIEANMNCSCCCCWLNHSFRIGNRNVKCRPLFRDGVALWWWVWIPLLWGGYCVLCHLQTNVRFIDVWPLILQKKRHHQLPWADCARPRRVPFAEEVRSFSWGRGLCL